MKYRLKCRQFNPGIVLLAVLLLTGCYESPVPLSEFPVAPIDKRLINSWRSVPGSEGETIYSLNIYKFNDREILAAWREGDEERAIIARGFVTGIGKHNIANMQGIESITPRERTFLFFRYRFDTNRDLIVNVLEKGYGRLPAAPFRSPASLNEFLRGHIEEDGLFGKDIRFRLADPLQLYLRREQQG